MRIVPILAALALGACQTTPPTPEPAPQPEIYRIVDLTDDFTAFYDRTEGMETAARVAAFKQEFNALFPGFYDTARMEGRTTPEQYDARIARALEVFPRLRERYEATTAGFDASIAPARESFLAAFPDMQPVGDIYFVHSIGEMDGGTREINGVTYPIFGADVMAQIYEPGGTTPFFQHELFHFYHRAFFTDCEPLWCSLWREGLATYVSEQLNPGADDLALLLTLPRPIRPEVDANLPHAVCELTARLDSEAVEDYAPFFWGSENIEGLPPRSGYYLGYLVAKEAGRTRSMQELAHLTPDQVRPIVDAALAQLATCPAN
jgi:hypothetical protein